MEELLSYNWNVYKVFKNGNVYVGEFKEGSMSGFGVLKYRSNNEDNGKTCA